MRTRDLEGRWYDVFADWTAADQAAALKVLEVLHRQKQKEESARALAAVKTGKCPHGVGTLDRCDKCEAGQ